jgi:putative glutamine amidotransferase
MKHVLLLFASLILITNSFSQDFFNTDYNERKKYIILTNPTVRNLQTIRYLNNAKLLDINNRKTKFVGVYFTGQKYDFSLTKQYIEEQKLENFFLHEIHGELNENNLFATNDCSKELKKVFENSVGVFFLEALIFLPGFMVKIIRFL